MGQIDFSALKDILQNNTSNGNNGGGAQNGPRVSYFQLKNNGDEAVVRIMHDSPADFDIVTVHPYSIGGKFRNVNCIRNAQDLVDACPFCANGEKLQYKFYIHLLVYERNEQGQLVAVPKVWERPAAYADTIKNLCDEYPPLSDNVFKIKRNGAAGSTSTTYDILLASPTVYKPDVYVKNAAAFDGYKAVGTAVVDKDYEGMIQLLTGSADTAAPAAPAMTPARSYTPASTPAATQQPARTYVPDNAPAAAHFTTSTAPAQPTRPATYDAAPAAQQPQVPVNGDAFARPRRFYN